MVRQPGAPRSVAAALRRAGQGPEDYLVVRAPGGEPVAKTRIDYASEAGTGVFSHLAMMGPLQGLGVATMLIGAGEQRVRARGLAFAALGVQDDNPPGAPPLPAARIPSGRLPGCGHQDLHPDYFPGHRAHGPWRSLPAMWHISAFTPDNGPLRVIPDSHSLLQGLPGTTA